MTAPAIRPGRPLVLAAWKPELARLRGLLRQADTDPSSSWARKVALETVGVGLIEAAAGTARALDRHRPSCVVLVGTCGAYADQRRGGTKPETQLQVGGVVVVRRAVLADIGVVRGLAYHPAVQPTRLESQAALARSLCRAAGIDEAMAACPVAITQDGRAGMQLARATEAEVENLEVFAALQVARKASIPFAAVLGIANQVGAKAHAEWRANAAAAAAAACEAVALWLRGTNGPRTRPAAGPVRSRA